VCTVNALKQGRKAQDYIIFKKNCLIISASCRKIDQLGCYLVFPVATPVVLNHRHFAYTPLKNIWKGSILVSSTDISHRILFSISIITDGMNKSTNLAKVTLKFHSTVLQQYTIYT